MKLRRKSTLLFLVVVALLVTLCPVGSAWHRAGAADKAANRKKDKSKKNKVSPDLGERLRAGADGEQPVEVVLQLNGKPGGQLKALLNRAGVRLKGSFESFDSLAVSLPAGLVEELASF